MTRQLLTTKQAAEFLGVSSAFLNRDRCEAARIPFVQLGARAIRYRPEDLEAFVASSARRSTSEYQQGTASAA
ncbi:AlpA family transcriptional regulator [Bacterioplanoides sp. SCSIO 12839]|uniref:helix-turn-helix transcriptional regulator n=1 Tax=Bacterioplanoides sp. SCSIO 12839 TaxID=2829569 RepID=UPI00210547E5|nr:helix-turn-helix domain-containing protein [Bacterioplanoides sp. SCSIO 12839]UTW46764.1 helix-turn-helix domain-containing protein [Bacterioplanoides sp. SCSIO 12839]